MIHILADVLLESIKITALVTVMMLAVEYASVKTRGRFFSKLRADRFGRVLFGAAMGLIPGCVGGFATVSMYSQGLLSFGALVAMMIASSGDEAFVMLAMFPGKALILFAVLFVFGILAGSVVELLTVHRQSPASPSAAEVPEAVPAGGRAIALHLWKRVLKGHFLSIFLWTFGALLVIRLGMQYIDLTTWLHDNVAVLILLAVLVGIIPDSGPHLIFVTMFAQGLAPFSVLLASSISQDGHSALPLLAESKLSFVRAKLVNCVVAAVAGYALYFFGM